MKNRVFTEKDFVHGKEYIDKKFVIQQKITNLQSMIANCKTQVEELDESLLLLDKEYSDVFETFIG
jgi:hypothetical protein